jgi:glycosyltransferase involved in cell wall biosynthesis
MVGGTETYLSRIAPAIKSLGVDMEICTLERTGPLVAEVEAAGIQVHGTRFIDWKSWRDSGVLFRAVQEIRQLVTVGRFDIVHTHLFWADVLGVTAARLAGCGRIIVSRRALHDWAHPRNPIFHGLEQVTNLFANELIANCQAVLDDVAAHERLLPSIRTVVYNGVDVRHYQFGQPGLERALRLVTVGALAPRKGQEYAIEALAILAGSGLEASLTLVGAGPDDAMLRRRASQAGVRDRVTFVGEQSDPRPYLAKADIFVLPSRQEGFSNALLEAMASGLPVIATDVGGNAEAIVDGEGGRIVPPQQPRAIASAIAELAPNRPRMAEMGRANRQRVADVFSLEASARHLAEWYLREPYVRDAVR